MTDSTILNLSKSHIDASKVNTTTNPLKTKRVVRYFLSYARQNKKQKTDLMELLEKRLSSDAEFDFQVWTDNDILIGEQWHAEIQKAIQVCDFGLLLISYEFFNRKYITEHELPSMVTESPSTGRYKALPIGLCKVAMDGSTNLIGLENFQIFLDNKGRFFSELSGRKKEEFAEQLWQKLRTVAKKYPALSTSDLLPTAPPSPVSPIRCATEGNDHSQKLNEFEQIIIINIRVALERKAMASLNNRLQALIPEHPLAEALCAAMDVGEAIDLLHKAVSESLGELKETGIDAQTINDFCDGVRRILGWLAIRAVNDGWVMEQLAGLASNQGFDLEVSLRNPACVELIIARAGQRCATWNCPEGAQVRSKGGLDLNRLQKMGFGPTVQTEEIKCAIWKMVFKEDKYPPSFTAEDDDWLNANLKEEGQWLQEYYVIREGELSHNPLNNPVVMEKLKHDLSALKTIAIGIPGRGKALLLSEHDLGAKIRVFLKAIEEQK